MLPIETLRLFAAFSIHLDIQSESNHTDTIPAGIWFGCFLLGLEVVVPVAGFSSSTFEENAYFYKTNVLAIIIIFGIS